MMHTLLLLFNPMMHYTCIIPALYHVFFMDSTSVVLKAAQRDLPGAVERISRCVEVLARFPGLIRFPMG